MSKQSSLFGAVQKTPEPATQSAEPEPTMTAPEPPAPAASTDAAGRKYPVATRRQGKRVATVYLEPEALRQLLEIAFDAESTIQALLTEGVNAVFQARGLSRIA